MNEPRYLVNHLYTADPSAHVFENRIFIYPSHDIDTGIPENDLGDQFDMRDYHVFSMTSPESDIIDHGKVLDIEDVPWAGRQMWAPDAAFKDGMYYFYFPAKDKTNIFRIGVATSDRPEGPFKAQTHPIIGSYSIDPAVFKDDDGTFYMYFGGLWGGQLQWYRNNKMIECGKEPAETEPALCPKVVVLDQNMIGFREDPSDLLIIDAYGNPLLAGDHDRRFFEASWMHKFRGKYYFSYSTGNTHMLCYGISHSPFGPFTFQGIILTPVVGWTTHHSICEFNGRWYLFHHDSIPSGGKTWLRSIKVIELKHNEDGTIETIKGSRKR